MCTPSPMTQIQVQPYKSQEIIIFGPSDHNDYTRGDPKVTGTDLLRMRAF
jgi:hypothetical protein